MSKGRRKRSKNELEAKEGEIADSNKGADMRGEAVLGANRHGVMGNNQGTNGVSKKTPKIKGRPIPRLPCFSFEKGYCKNGNNCSYIHDQQLKFKPCKSFSEGTCRAGNNCTYSHIDLNRSTELCRFVTRGSCVKQNCPYSHDTKLFPCVYHHLYRKCNQGDKCQYSHEKLTPFMIEWLDKSDESFKKHRERKAAEFAEKFTVEPRPPADAASMFVNHFAKSDLESVDQICKETSKPKKRGDFIHTDEFSSTQNKGGVSDPRPERRDPRFNVTDKIRPEQNLDVAIHARSNGSYTGRPDLTLDYLRDPRSNGDDLNRSLDASRDPIYNGTFNIENGRNWDIASDPRANVFDNIENESSLYSFRDPRIDGANTIEKATHESFPSKNLSPNLPNPLNMQNYEPCVRETRTRDRSSEDFLNVSVWNPTVQIVDINPVSESVDILDKTIDFLATETKKKSCFGTAAEYKPEKCSEFLFETPDLYKFELCNMVCKKCETKLRPNITPDKWKEGSSNTKTNTEGRKLNENKLLSRNRFNPLIAHGQAVKCKTATCKKQLHDSKLMYCQPCAYKNGVCAMCGVKVLDTTFYRQTTT